MASTDRPRADTRASRTAGGSGFAFILLLLVGAGMASVPGADDSTAAVRAYYDEHAGVVAVAQLVELAATLPLVVLVRGLSRSPLVDATTRATLVAGVAMVVAAVLTTVPPLWLCVDGPTGPATRVRNLALLSDLVDVLLFLMIAWFAAACWRAWRGVSWVGWTALGVAALCALRALEIMVGRAVLEVVAPVAFLVLIAALSGQLIRRSPGT
jgi:hypothetical protein